MPPEDSAPPAPSPSPSPAPTPAPSSGGDGDRPAWLPEKYKSAEDFRKGYDNVNALVGKSRDEIRDSLRAEVEQELTAKQREGVPADVEGYVLPKFDDAPVDADALAKHPLVDWWKKTAHDKGLPQGVFEEGIKNYVQGLVSELPNVVEEKKALGENADARVEKVNAWVNQTVTDPAEFAAIQKLGTTAAGIKALERIMAASKGSRQDLTPGNEGGREPETSEAEIKKLMQSKEYYHPAHRDPKIVAKVENWFKTNYGKPA